MDVSSKLGAHAEACGTKPTMPASSDRAQSVIELALQRLQDERTACVARLRAVLRAPGETLEVESYMKRIDRINAELIRIASAHVVH
jgi:hypothetical protein